MRAPHSVELFGVRLEVGLDPVTIRVAFTDQLPGQVDHFRKVKWLLLEWRALSLLFALACAFLWQRCF